MKRNSFCHLAASAPSTLIAVLLSALTWNAHAQTQPVCKALASANNQLYLVASDGSLIGQFPTDTQAKSGIGLSPDGSKVVYIPAANPAVFTLADTAGHMRTITVPESSQGPFTGVAWNSANILKVRYHAGRDNDVFSFFAVPADYTRPLGVIGRTMAGVNCAAQSADDNAIACLSENKLVVNKKILVDQDPLAANNTTVIGSANILLGTTFTTQTSPAFQVRVLGISDGVTLQVTLPDGSWSQSRIPLGSALPISWDDSSYGFIPVSVNSAKGEVTLRTVQSNGRAGSFDGAITWSPSNYIALVTHGAQGAQLQVVKSSGNQAPMTAALGAMEQVMAIHYATPGLLMLRTRSGFAAVPINPVNGSTASLQTGTPIKLAATINVKLPGGFTPASVEGWSCQ
jgi:hypothetical protein